MKKLLFFIMFVSITTGCSQEIKYSELETNHVKNSLQDFLDLVEDENGNYLYFDGDDAYVFLNRENIIQGEKVQYFTDFFVDSNGGKLQVHYKQEETGDYSNHSLKHHILYKININKTYDSIHVFDNGKEIPFDVISGN